MKRYAHIFKDSLDCRTAFTAFATTSRHQRSDSGMWYASHDETHKFFSATHPEKLRGTNWDSIEIAEDVTALDKAVILWNCMDAGVSNIKDVITAESPVRQSKKR